jgi:O-succinylbenzoic acid--CoA ligase
MFSILKQKAFTVPNDVYIIYKGQEYTFLNIYRNANRVAEFLSEKGVVSGNRIGVLLSTSTEYIYLIFALMKLRAIIVPMNTRLTINELNWQISKVEISKLVYNKEFKDLVLSLSEINGSIISIDSDLINYHSDIPLEISSEHISDTQENSLTHCIIFTSGTTKSPKGVTLSYTNHLAHFEGHADRLPMKKGDRWLNCIPLYHVGGLQIILRCLIFGMPVVLHGRFEIDVITNSIYNDNITIISLVPTMLKRILKTTELQDTNLRCILLGGAKTTLDLVNQSIALNLPICTTYGMTESNSQICTILTEDLKRKPESVGKPVFGLSLIIVNDNDEVLGSNEIGEICVRGPSITKGYYNLSKKNSQSFVGDHFKTGDLGYIDKDGDLFVLQRRVDLIISGGENVFPSEVEKVLLEHESISNVIVFGEEDDEWGQIVAAALITDEILSMIELTEYCKKYLAGYKIPRNYYILSEFEETSSGKIIRQKVIESTVNVQKLNS